MKKIFIFCLTTLLFTACGDKPPSFTPQDTSESSTYTQNPDWETFTVSTQGDYPPFSFKNQHGILTGFEKELIESIATASQFNVNVVDARRADILIQLDNGMTDVWASAISIDTERQANMTLSEPYLSFSRTIMILDTPQNANIKTVADLQGKKLAYSSVGSTEKAHTIAINKNESLAIAESSAFLAIRAVYTGKAVGVVGSSPVLNYYAMQYPSIGVRLIPVNGQKIQVAFALKKGNTELRDKINVGLAKVKADGTYDKLIRKWFGQIQ